MTPQEAKVRAREKQKLLNVFDLASAIQKCGERAQQLDVTLSDGTDIVQVLGAIANDLKLQVDRNIK